MNDENTITEDGAADGKANPENLFNRFFDELGQEEGFGEIAEQLRKVILEEHQPAP